MLSVFKNFGKKQCVELDIHRMDWMLCLDEALAKCNYREDPTEIRESPLDPERVVTVIRPGKGVCRKVEWRRLEEALEESGIKSGICMNYIYC